MRFLVTAYCPCEKCMGNNKGYKKTALGTTPRPHHTLAAPSIYKFGTKIHLQGYGIYIVEDRCAFNENHRIDMFFSNHHEVLAWGRKYVDGYVQ